MSFIIQKDVFFSLFLILSMTIKNITEIEWGGDPSLINWPSAE